VHASLTEHISSTNPALLDSLATPEAAAALNNEITRQAAMISYVDDFWLMFIMTLCVIPLLLLVKPPARNAPVAVDHAAMD
jgi:DHA2 family multidrug resistance protein